MAGPFHTEIGQSFPHFAVSNAVDYVPSLLLEFQNACLDQNLQVPRNGGLVSLGQGCEITRETFVVQEIAHNL